MISPEVLRRYTYFAGITDEGLKQIAMIADEQAIPGNTRIFNEGDSASHMLIITQGEINIEFQLGSGELRIVDTMVAGDLLGWSALVEPYKMTANGTTTKNTELIRFDGIKLRQLCEKDSAVGYRLVMQIAKLLAHRLEGASVQLAVV
jgi:CRP/FNR family transcriptional regulator, cyclic AMP receptor protein